MRKRFALGFLLGLSVLAGCGDDCANKAQLRCGEPLPVIDARPDAPVHDAGTD